MGPGVDAEVAPAGLRRPSESDAHEDRKVVHLPAWDSSVQELALSTPADWQILQLYVANPNFYTSHAAINSTCGGRALRRRRPRAAAARQWRHARPRSALSACTSRGPATCS